MCRATKPLRFCSHVAPPVTPAGSGRDAMARALPARSYSRMNPLEDRATALTPCRDASASYACAAAYDIHGYVMFPDGNGWVFFLHIPATVPVLNLLHPPHCGGFLWFRRMGEIPRGFYIASAAVEEHNKKRNPKIL